MVLLKKTMTLQERVDSYHESFPKYPKMFVDKDWLMGIWVLGNMYKRRTDYYGAYPGNYLKRLYSLCPDRQKTLHLFSGTVEPASINEITMDCNIHLSPSIVADARNLPFCVGAFDTVMADPPYSANDALHYNTPMIARGKILKQVRSITSKGGHLFWLDTVRPMYSNKEWKQVGAVGVLVSTNTRTRCLSMFEAI